jgi:hypothetical protein
MSNKMCGECKYFDAVGQCDKVIEYNLVHPGDEACEFFEPATTNGDKIRQMRNAELADTIEELAFRFCSRRDFINWLGAPAESEGKDD